MIYFYNNNSKILHRRLQEILPQTYLEVLQQFNNSQIFIFDNLTNAKGFEKLASMVKNRTIFNIFKKDDYIFFGPFMKSLEDACPYCFLLTISVDESVLKALSIRHAQRTNSEKIYNINLKDTKQNIHCIDISDGRVSYFSKPFAHPSCTHCFGKLNKKSYKGKSDLTESELLSILINKTTGIIREIKPLKQLANAQIVEKMGKNEVIFSWFQNPVFPLFPQVGFLDLAIGTDASYKGALTRAIFETLERYSVLSLPESEPDEVGPYVKLGHKAVDPTKFWQYAPEQLDLKNFAFKNVTRTANLHWRKMYSIIGEEKLIPEDFIYVNLRKPSSYHNNTTNGCAAHTNFYKACINATLELIERDNIMRHWAEGNSSPHVNLATVKGKIKENIKYVTGLGFDVKIINCSRFQGIYTFIICLINKNDSRPKAIATSGCSFEPEEAVLKGFREAIGSLLISFILEDKKRTKVLTPKEVVDPEDHAIFYREPKYFEILKHYYEKSGDCSLESFKNKYINDNYKTILKELIVVLKEYGVEVYFIDLTFHPLKRFGINVVRAISPEMMPITFGTNMLKLGGGGDEKFHYTRTAFEYPHPYS